MADFTGFYLDGIHSSTYGILRVSDGDRYKDGLIPEFEDYSIELTGGNGDLYGGRRYKPTKFTIPIAFDHMTEKQLRGLRQWLGGENLREFRFDERPYKAYWVKVASKPELEYICFMEDADDNFIEKERIYKGEGEIEFIAYDPFGYCVNNKKDLLLSSKTKSFNIGKNWQELNTYLIFNAKADNIIEWAEVSGLKSSLNGYNIFTKEEKGEKNYYTAKLYNPGDFEADFVLLLSTFEKVIGIGNGRYQVTITITNNEGLNEAFQFEMPKSEEISSSLEEYELLLNTKNHSLILKANNIKSSCYNFIKSNNWLKIPIGESIIKVECSNAVEFNLDIQYDYKYY